MKSKKNVGVICLALVALLIVATVGLFIYQTWQNEWQIEGDTLAKFGIVFVGLVLTMIKLVSKVGNSLSPRKYESMYKREIGAAFSASDKRGAKRALIKAIAHYNESKYNN